MLLYIYDDSEFKVVIVIPKLSCNVIPLGIKKFNDSIAIYEKEVFRRYHNGEAEKAFIFVPSLEYIPSCDYVSDKLRH